MPGRWKTSGMISARLSRRAPGTEVLGDTDDVSIRGSTVSERVRVAGSDQGPSPPVSLARTCTWCCLAGVTNITNNITWCYKHCVTNRVLFSRCYKHGVV